MTTIFVGYPSQPPQVGQTIEAALEKVRSSNSKLKVASWRQLDIPGRFIIDKVLEKIDAADFVVMDITRLNFNVTFEIGYGLGKSKRVVLTLNGAAAPDSKDIDRLGVYDTLGYQSYVNSDDLAACIAKVSDVTPGKFPMPEVNTKAPIFLLKNLHKTDSSVRIASRLKKSGFRFRSFDPAEQSRLSTLEAVEQVASSIAVVINLLSEQSTDAKFNNLRGAFLAGLAWALEKDLLLLQEAASPVPLDYRDFVSEYYQPKDIDKHIANLAPRVTLGLQTLRPNKTTPSLSALESLELGDPAAENEIASLQEYFLDTEEYRQVLAGQGRIVVGRKGSGKTALFFQIRDAKRRHRQNLVLDLKPDGHQLKHFKEILDRFLGDAVKEHAATAFWEYTLLLEVRNKLLKGGWTRSRSDPETAEAYDELRDLVDDTSEGDFSERMLALVRRISNSLDELEIESSTDVYLDSGQVTEVIYQEDIGPLRDSIAKSLRFKKSLWILIDNLDKGWPTRGVSHMDIIILRGLLDATRKLERSFRKSAGLDVHTAVFLRNDVYELLVNETPDRGKEPTVRLDWTDQDLLRELLRRRLTHTNAFDKGDSFQSVWATVCTSHVRGEESSQYVIDRSLMRPRNLLRVVAYAKGNAINLQHSQIAAEDLLKACKFFSQDLSNELGLEVRDVFPEAEDVLFEFLGANRYLTLRDVREILKSSSVPDESHDRLIEVLLWFAFLGVVKGAIADPKETFIYDVYYNMKKLKKLARDLEDEETRFSIHRAFWPFLEISES